MKLGRVRIGERFIFDHISGVWAKVNSDRAKCVYGKNFGKEEVVVPDMSVYVIFEDRTKFRRIQTAKQDNQEYVCPKCGGPLIGKPLGCPICNVIVGDISHKSENKAVDALNLPHNESQALEGTESHIEAEKPVETPVEWVPEKSIEEEPVEEKMVIKLREPEIGVGAYNDHAVQKKRSFSPYNVRQEGGLTMVLADEDENVITEISNATAAQVAAYSRSECVKLTDKSSRQILETLMDHTTQTLYVILGKEMTE